MSSIYAGSLKGHFLVAMPGLGDPNFSQTVTCICEHNDQGAMGIVVNRLHDDLHAKDISVGQSAEERGKVTGTPVGCACGEGVIDWAKVIEICRSAPRDIVFSVECGTIEQAARSVKHLQSLL